MGLKLGNVGVCCANLTNLERNMFGVCRIVAALGAGETSRCLKEESERNEHAVYLANAAAAAAGYCCAWAHWMGRKNEHFNAAPSQLVHMVLAGPRIPQVQHIVTSVAYRHLCVL
jgi:hypothetical protein